jgi:hypothetical protein
MANPALTQEKAAEALKAFEENAGNMTAAAHSLGISPSTLRNRVKRAQELYSPSASQFTADVEVEQDASIDEIRARRHREFHRKSAKASADRQIDVRLDCTGPFGLVVLGDTHWDNPGSDLPTYERHAECILSTPGLYSGHIGDVLDNWVGRLERLYAEHTTTPTEGWKLAEHYLRELAPKLLFLSGGNHDGWSGHRDPLRYIVRGTEIVYRQHRTRIRLLQKKGEPVLTCNARHAFSGRSMYNNAHAALRELLFGCRDDIAICGHYHTSGVSVTKDPETGRKLTGVLVGSYKVHDDFAASRGFSDQNISPSATFICNTALEQRHPDRVTLWWDPLEGADYLQFLRKK